MALYKFLYYYYYYYCITKPEVTNQKLLRYKARSYKPIIAGLQRTKLPTSKLLNYKGRSYKPVITGLQRPKLQTSNYWITKSEVKNH